MAGQSSDGGYIFSLKAFLTLDYSEFHFLSFTQGAIALAANSVEMHENIFSVFAPNEAITFGVIEPLDVAAFTFCHNWYSF